MIKMDGDRLVFLAVQTLPLSKFSPFFTLLGI